MEEHKAYLGDSVYACVEQGMIKLTTENGSTPSNTIYLELQVFDALKNYVETVERIYAQAKQQS